MSNSKVLDQIPKGTTKCFNKEQLGDDDSILIELNSLISSGQLALEDISQESSGEFRNPLYPSNVAPKPYGKVTLICVRRP